MSPSLPETGMHEITPAEAARMVDSAARRYLRMSGPEFVQAWNEGRWPDPDAASGVMRVAGLLPLLDEQF